MIEPKIATAVTDYMAAWNEPDAGVRNALLERCWAENGRYVDPTVDLTGRNALSRHIATVQAARPGARLEFVSAADAHHGFFRFLWRLVKRDGTDGDVSIDFGEIDTNRRIVRMVGFFGQPLPV